ncbi:AAA family ATPase [Rhizobium rhizogenes]
MLNLKVINLFGAPGVGKSTVATGLFNLMKIRGHSVEYVSEYAKDLTWSKDWMGLAHQPSLLAQQDYRLFRLNKQVEWVITDSPLPMQIAYQGEEWLNAGLDKFTWDLFARYENFNVLLQRSGEFPYEQAGRNQTSEQAMVLDNVIDNLFHTATLDDEDFSLELKSSFEAPHEVYAWLMDPE